MNKIVQMFIYHWAHLFKNIALKETKSIIKRIRYLKSKHYCFKTKFIMKVLKKKHFLIVSHYAKANTIFSSECPINQ